MSFEKSCESSVSVLCNRRMCFLKSRNYTQPGPTKDQRLYRPLCFGRTLKDIPSLSVHGLILHLGQATGMYCANTTHEHVQWVFSVFHFCTRALQVPLIW